MPPFPPKKALLLFVCLILVAGTTLLWHSCSVKNGNNTSLPLKSMDPKGEEPSLVNRHILFVSDYAGQGYSVPAEKSVPTLLQRSIDSARLKYLLIDYSFQGESVREVTKRIPYLDQRIDALILLSGASDVAAVNDLELVRNHYLSLIENVGRKRADMKIVVGGVYFESEQDGYSNRLNQVLLEVTRLKNGRFIPSILGQEKDVSRYLWPDGVHLRETGHQQAASQIWKVLKPMLEDQMKSEMNGNSVD
jgi:acyl-CoA thioesterase-1